MTDHQAAVQIAAHHLPFNADGVTTARTIVASLHTAGWLHDPTEVAQHEADLLAVEAQRADLAARLFAQEDEIEALRAEVERLRGRLGSAAAFGDVLTPDAVRDILRTKGQGL